METVTLQSTKLVHKLTDLNLTPSWGMVGRFTGLCAVVQGTGEDILLASSSMDKQTVMLQVWRGWAGWNSRIFTNMDRDIWRSGNDQILTQEMAEAEVIRQAINRGYLGKIEALPE
jgi:hypothetical protein